jgi:hypothetical protein
MIAFFFIACVFFLLEKRREGKQIYLILLNLIITLILNKKLISNYD